MDNFRPIMIVAILAKIFKIILKDRLISYLKNIFSWRNNLASATNRSIVKTASELISGVVNGLDQDLSTIAYLCDRFEGFNCVSVDALIYKLEYFGIKSNILELFTSYLTNRLQNVNCEGNDSSHLVVRNGVLRGSII